MSTISGRRKEATAVVRLTKGKGNLTVNKKNIDEYFGRDVAKLKRISVGPIKLGELESGKIIKLDYNELEELKSIVFK